MVEQRVVGTTNKLVIAYCRLRRDSTSAVRRRPSVKYDGAWPSRYWKVRTATPRACNRFATVLEASEGLEAVMSRGRISAPNKLDVLQR